MRTATGAITTTFLRGLCTVTPLIHHNLIQHGFQFNMFTLGEVWHTQLYKVHNIPQYNATLY